MRNLTVTQTAKAIRLWLKERGIKPVSVISSRFAGGTSVSVHVRRADYVQFCFWEELQQFAYGSFNPMNDSYEHQTKTILYEGEQCEPGAKYVQVFPTNQ